MLQYPMQPQKQDASTAPAVDATAVAVASAASDVDKPAAQDVGSQQAALLLRVFVLVSDAYEHGDARPAQLQRLPRDLALLLEYFGSVPNVIVDQGSLIVSVECSMQFVMTDV